MTTTHNKKVFLLIALLVLISFVPVCPAYSTNSQDVYPAKVKDISDRAYEPAVIELLDGAKESIVISMYIINVHETGPIRLLMKDLEEALERNVTVEIYLNTRFQSRPPDGVGSEEAFNVLREKGGKIYTITPSTLLHDKLIVVDKRYLIEGSANWSVSALKNNYESAVLIDCPQLAEERLIRLKRLTLEGQEPPKAERPDRPKKSGVLAKDSVVQLSSQLLSDLSLFSNMVTSQDARAMDAYLLLTAYTQEWKSNKFFLSLEKLAVDLSMPDTWSDTALRRQSIRTLKKLQDRYNLIEVNFAHGKDAWVVVKELSGNTFELRGEFFDPDFLLSMSQSAKFVLLIKALLKKEGTSIDSFTRKEIYERFGISKRTLRKGVREAVSYKL